MDQTTATIVIAVVSALVSGLIGYAGGARSALTSADKMVQNVLSSPLLMQQSRDLAKLIPPEALPLLHDLSTLVEKASDPAPATDATAKS